MDGLSSIGDIEEMVYNPSGSSTGLNDFERFYRVLLCLSLEILGENREISSQFRTKAECSCYGRTKAYLGSIQ